MHSLCSFIRIQPSALRIAYQDEGRECVFFLYRITCEAALRQADLISDATTIHLIDLVTKQQVLIRDLPSYMAPRIIDLENDSVDSLAQRLDERAADELPKSTPEPPWIIPQSRGRLIRLD
jgi:hypothetical protein